MKKYIVIRNEMLLGKLLKCNMFNFLQKIVIGFIRIRIGILRPNQQNFFI